MTSLFIRKEVFGMVSSRVLVAQWIERSPPKRQVARSIRAEDESSIQKSEHSYINGLSLFFLNQKNRSGGGP